MDLHDVVARFAVPDPPFSVRRHGSGHIHDSYLVKFAENSEIAGALLQRINTRVFPNPSLLMENIQRVTEHLVTKIQDAGLHDIARRTLTIVPTLEGALIHSDQEGTHWRLYRFIERTITHDIVTSPKQAERAGRAFAAFQSLLGDLPEPRLHDIIPAFHDTPKRFEALDDALRGDAFHRAADAQAEIQFAQAHRSTAGLLLDAHQSGEIPERIVHNDAKIGNVLFDENSGESLCVVDLDTVMLGLAPHDFGDMVRTMTATAAEDERDLSRVGVDHSLFEGMVRGYLSGTNLFLTPAERERLVLASRLIALEQGVRFLTDFLVGDVYYGARRPGHNLDRCRTQFKLVEAIMRDEEELERIVERFGER